MAAQFGDDFGDGEDDESEDDFEDETGNLDGEGKGEAIGEVDQRMDQGHQDIRSIVVDDSVNWKTPAVDAATATATAKSTSTSTDPSAVDWDFWGAVVNDYEEVARMRSRDLSKAIQKGIPAVIRGTIVSDRHGYFPSGLCLRLSVYRTDYIRWEQRREGKENLESDPLKDSEHSRKRI